MSEFRPAFEFMLPHEGEYVNDPSDPGGETKYGISRRSYPALDIAGLTIDQAAVIYQRDYWDPTHYAEIDSQPIASKVFDLAVNVGFYEANRIVQQACGDCGLPLSVDGHLGPQSVDVVNRLDALKLLDAIRARAADYYKHLVQRRPSNARFLGGWLNRAEA